MKHFLALTTIVSSSLIFAACATAEDGGSPSGVGGTASTGAVSGSGATSSTGAVSGTGATTSTGATSGTGATSSTGATSGTGATASTGGAGTGGATGGTGGSVDADECLDAAECGTGAPNECWSCIPDENVINRCVLEQPASCDNGTLEACEKCEIGDTLACTGIAGKTWKGGDATCKECTGWDESGCKACLPDTPAPTCGSIDASKPEGTVVCKEDGSGWDAAGCSVCIPNATMPCSTALPSKPVGNATCNAEGTAYDTSACMFCAPDSTKACSVDVPDRPFGNQTCKQDGSAYDNAACNFCDPGVTTKACVDLPGPYTGGTATCAANGDDFDTSTCEQCGDDIKQASEACDGTDTPAKTCGDLGYTVNTSTSVPCKAGRCSYDQLTCAACTPDISAANCKTGTFSCSNNNCDDKQCGGGGTCTFTCSDDGTGAECTNMSCNDGANCTFSCNQQSGKLCSYTCLEGSTCKNTVGYNDKVTAACKTGAVCEVACGQDGACNIACDAGSSCSIVATAYNAKPTGTAHCAAGHTCDYTFGSQSAISGLSIVCEKGATCNIKTQAYNTDVSNIVCKNGSTCNLTGTQGASDFSYTCEAGATCTCSTTGTCTKL